MADYELQIKNTRNKSEGFTLVETLIAISIFTTSVLVLMTVLSGSISDINYAKKKMIASYLAVEGIEYIRNMRDTYLLLPDDSGNSGWNDGFRGKINLCENSNGCYLNDKNILEGTTAIEIETCSDYSCPELFYDSETGRYNGYGLGEASGFIRKIRAIYLGEPQDEVQIISTVFWTQGSGDYSISFSENLFNWIE